MRQLLELAYYVELCYTMVTTLKGKTDSLTMYNVISGGNERIDPTMRR